MRWKSGMYILSRFSGVLLVHWLIRCVVVLCRYDAIRVWNKHLTSPDSEYWVQLSAGTAVGESLYHFLSFATNDAIWCSR